MRKHARLFGLNYAHCSAGELRGCINDVRLMSSFLQDKLGFDDVKVYTDDTARYDTSKAGILQHLSAIATKSWRDSLDVVWIHFSGHGSQMEDRTGDEDDGQDECLVPSDYETSGFIWDDEINRIFENFNPKTRVICVFDCCHSGTMADLKYGFDEDGNVSVENTKSSIKSKILTISGCKDEQTSADAYGVAGQNQFTGAMTACLLDVLEDPQAHTDIFHMMQELHKQLQERRFSQRPLVGATYNLREDPAWLSFDTVALEDVAIEPAGEPSELAQVSTKEVAVAETQPIIPNVQHVDDLDDPKWKDADDKRDNCCCYVQ